MKEKRNQWGGLIAEEPGGHEREHGRDHPLVDNTTGGIFIVPPPGFRIQPSQLRKNELPRPSANSPAAPPEPRCCYGQCRMTLAEHEENPPRAGTYHWDVWNGQVRHS